MDETKSVVSRVKVGRGGGEKKEESPAGTSMQQEIQRILQARVPGGMLDVLVREAYDFCNLGQQAVDYPHVHWSGRCLFCATSTAALCCGPSPR
jgi:hypothetical protein